MTTVVMIGRYLVSVKKQFPEMGPHLHDQRSTNAVIGKHGRNIDGVC